MVRVLAAHLLLGCSDRCGRIHPLVDDGRLRMPCYRLKNQATKPAKGGMKCGIEARTLAPETGEVEISSSARGG
jgi:hypothetical protein